VLRIRCGEWHVGVEERYSISYTLEYKRLSHPLPPFLTNSRPSLEEQSITIDSGNCIFIAVYNLTILHTREIDLSSPLPSARFVISLGYFDMTHKKHKN
jgi:hypothetical protein